MTKTVYYLNKGNRDQALKSLKQNSGIVAKSATSKNLVFPVWGIQDENHDCPQQDRWYATLYTLTY